MVESELISLLCCPETHQELRLVNADMLARLNERVAAGTLKNRGGQPVRQRLEGGLIRSDEKLLYPILENIPVMLIEEAIPL